MKVLITGITGMAGSHLADYLIKHVPEAEVHGTRRWQPRPQWPWWMFCGALTLFLTASSCEVELVDREASTNGIHRRDRFEGLPKSSGVDSIDLNVEVFALGAQQVIADTAAD